MLVGYLGKFQGSFDATECLHQSDGDCDNRADNEKPSGPYIVSIGPLKCLTCREKLTSNPVNRDYC